MAMFCWKANSCSVYGDAQGDWVDEQTPPDPGRGHGDVLLESEQLLTSIGDRRVCILRLGALYGPGRDLDRRLRGLAGLERPGSGGSYSNWLHVADAAGALEAAVDGEWAGVVNVVNDEPILLRDLVERSLQRQGLAPVHWLLSPPGPVPRFCSTRSTPFASASCARFSAARSQAMTASISMICCRRRFYPRSW